VDSDYVYLCALSGVCGLDVVETVGGELRLWGWRKGVKPLFLLRHSTGGQLTTNLELVRTRGLRLFN